MVSPLNPSAPMALAIHDGPCIDVPSSRVPLSQIMMGSSTCTPCRWNSATIGASRQAARHIVPKVELIPIVHAQIRVHWPEQHAVNAAITSAQILEITAHRIMAGDGIIKVSIMRHHLRLDKTPLRPLQCRFGVGVRHIPARRLEQCLHSLSLNPQARQPCRKVLRFLRPGKKFFLRVSLDDSRGQWAVGSGRLCVHGNPDCARHEKAKQS